MPAELETGWWLLDESVLYIGKASSPDRRVAQHYRTPLGAGRPHSDRYWLKILADLPALTIHYAVAADAPEAERVEDRLLHEFVTAAAPPLGHPEPSLPLPGSDIGSTSAEEAPSPPAHRHPSIGPAAHGWELGQATSQRSRVEPFSAQSAPSESAQWLSSPGGKRQVSGE